MAEKETKEEKMNECCKDKKYYYHRRGGHGGGAIYGLGLIGALVYYIQHASNFADGLLGVLKAIVWPALLIWQVLTTLKM
jgi:hypothetical protein